MRRGDFGINDLSWQGKIGLRNKINEKIMRNLFTRLKPEIMLSLSFKRVAWGNYQAVWLGERIQKPLGNTNGKWMRIKIKTKPEENEKEIEETIK